MAQYLIQDTTLTGIADAIRKKTGSNEAIKVSDMASQIEGITTGGSAEGVHYVTFMSEDGTTELYKRPVADGDDCADPVARGLISAPTKESTVQYDYAFVGWATTPNGAWDENVLKAVTEDKTVYAVFASAVRYYTITFYDDDGTTVLNTQRVAYGSTPSYTPTKEGVVLDYWTPELTTVTGNASYTAAWASAIAAGVFASGVTWKLMADGVFTISGEGRTDEPWSANSTPWYEHLSSIKSVVVEDGVTILGGSLFQGATNLTSITLPGSVNTIRASVFRDCTALTSIVLPEGLETIGAYVFTNCTNLKSVSLPNSLKTIGATAQFSAFYGCTSLTSITIPANVTFISYGTFQNCSKLTSVIFADTTKTWAINNTDGTGNTTVSVENPATNATNLVTKYYNKYWVKS